MVKKTENQVAMEQPAYMLVKIGWHEQLLFPIEQGKEYLGLYAGAMKVTGSIRIDATEPPKFTPNDQELSVSFLTETRYKELCLRALVEIPEGDENESNS